MSGEKAMKEDAASGLAAKALAVDMPGSHMGAISNPNCPTTYPASGL